jgi:hypothetical protein
MRCLRFAAAAACGCLGLSGAAYAQDESTEQGTGLRLSGFGTVGVTHTRAPDGWGFVRDFTQPRNDGGTRADIDSRLGLQAHYALTPRVEAVAQVVLKDRVQQASRSDALEWAFVAWRPDAHSTLRMGRVNPKIYMQADVRNVGFAYTALRPSVDYYGALPLYWADGVDAARTWTLGDTQWQAAAQVGFNGRVHFDVQRGFEPFTFSSKKSMVLSLTRAQGGLTLSASFARSDFKTDVGATGAPIVQNLQSVAALPVPEVAGEASALIEGFNLDGGWLSFMSLGADYQAGPWRLVAEGARISGDYAFINGHYGYIQAGRSIGAWTPYVVAGRAHTRGRPAPPPQWGVALAPVIGAVGAAQVQALGTSVVQGFVNSTRFDQSSLSLGVRWDVQPQMALKLQWDRVKVHDNGGGLWANSDLRSSTNYVVGVGLDFVF